MNNYKDVVGSDPFMRPYWRHERALRLAKHGGSKLVTRSDDAYIKEYKNFLIQIGKENADHHKLLSKNPGLYYAHSIHSRMQLDPEVGLTVEARLLCGMPVAKIASAYKTLTDTIEWYEKLFFNVHDYIEHRDWITRNVLVPASDSFALPTNTQQQPHAQNQAQTQTPVPHDAEAQARIVQPIVAPHFDMTLKLFSYFGGPLVCDTMISGFTERRFVHKPEDINDFFDTQFAMQIKRRSLQASTRFQITKYNVMELFALNSKIIEIQRSNISKDDKHTAVEKNIHAMMTDFDWRVGADGSRAYEGTLLGDLDKGKAEICASELIALGCGAAPDLSELEGRSIFRTESVRNAKS